VVLIGGPVRPGSLPPHRQQLGSVAAGGAPKLWAMC
jgi:hypothetical protein